MTWIGDIVPGHPGGPADPWLIDVQNINFTPIVAGQILVSE
jgi:hypothetical protein